MSLAKPQEWTIYGLSIETGIDRKTLGRLLENAEPVTKGNRDYYKMRQVCDALRGGGIKAQEQERTRLYRNQADHEELRVAEKSRQLIPVSEVDEVWGEIAIAIKSKLLAMPARIAQVALAASSLREVEEAIRVEIYSALNELSTGNLTKRSEVSGESESAAKVESGSVGGNGKSSKPRKQRRAGEVAQR
jgi:phage terminase Nu1 subunit (DNA packaging protein)